MWTGLSLTLIPFPWSVRFVLSLDSVVALRTNSFSFDDSGLLLKISKINNFKLFISFCEQHNKNTHNITMSSMEMEFD